MTAAAVPAPVVPCPRCRTAPLAGDRFCEVCGADLRATTAAVAGACRGCGHLLPAECDGWCPVCGTRLPDATEHVEIALDADGAVVSDRGHVRARNEDAVALSRGAGRVAAVVCDGVSSTRSSELAARAAADVALDVLLDASGPDQVGRASAERRTRSAVAAAAAAAAALVPRGTPSPPSCTLVSGVHEVSSGVLTVGWVGDSRAYWVAVPGASDGRSILMLTAGQKTATSRDGR